MLPLNTNSPLSKGTGSGLISLQRLRDIKQQISKDMNLVTDTSVIGETVLENPGDSVQGKETQKSKRKDKSKKKAKTDPFQDRLRSRVDKKMSERDKAIDMAVGKAVSLLHTEQSNQEWLVSGPRPNSPAQSGSSLPTGGTLGGAFGGGNFASVGSSAAQAFGSAPTYGSGNPYAGSSQDLSMGSADVDPFAQENLEAKLKEEAQELAEVQQRESEQRQSEMEWKAAEEAQAAKDLAAERQALLEQEFQSQQAEVIAEQESYVAPVESDATQMMASSMADQTEEMSFQPDEASVEQVTAEELEAKVQETINEAAGDGHAANQEMLQEQALKLREVQMETSVAREALAQEAPKFSQNLSLYMEEYSKSDSPGEQAMIRRAIEALLDGASDGMQAQVKIVREQVGGMFAQSEAAWTSRAAAKDAPVLKASSTRRENDAQVAAGTRQRDGEFLRNQAQKNLRQTPKSDALRSDKVSQALREEGLG